MAHLQDALSRAYEVVGLEQAVGGNEVFRQLMLARIIEPTSKLKSLRVLEEAGFCPPSYATVKRRLPVYAQVSSRQQLAAACAARAVLSPARLALYDVSTSYSRPMPGMGSASRTFKERCLDPQITIGLLTDAAGFPLIVHAVEGKKAETTTMLPVIQAFMADCHLPDVTIVADADMISATDQRATETAGLPIILGARIPDVPYTATQWRRGHPDRALVTDAEAARDAVLLKLRCPPP
jgi:hypothetical protein